MPSSYLAKTSVPIKDRSTANHRIFAGYNLSCFLPGFPCLAGTRGPRGGKPYPPYPTAQGLNTSPQTLLQVQQRYNTVVSILFSTIPI